MAAETFLAAAQQVGGLTAEVERAGADQILRGGALGQQVPLGIASASAAARSCREFIESAAQTCRDRALVIADYEIRLARYDRAYASYHQASYHWKTRYNRWWRSSGTMAHPGARPLPPPRPTPPPAWADVRRP